MKSLIELALEEDLSDAGDITSKAIFTDAQDTFTLVSKGSGLLCGIEIAKKVMQYLDSSIETVFHARDADPVTPGMPVARITGPVKSILTGERVVLNFLSHLSGIATKTRRYADAAAPAIILDTRKTIPGLRELQKYAVSVGGGKNHRMGLYDMVLIKDNHIDSAGGIARAVELVRCKWGSRFPVEVETRNLIEVAEAIDCKVERIMLDNMDNTSMAKAVELIAGSAETEASGNVTLERIASIAATGVDYISVGGLTHSVEALDFTLIKDT